MNLEAILPIKKWAELEKKINHKFGLNASVFDTIVDGFYTTHNQALQLSRVI